LNFFTEYPEKRDGYEETFCYYGGPYSGIKLHSLLRRYGKGRNGTEYGEHPKYRKYGSLRCP